VPKSLAFSKVEYSEKDKSSMEDSRNFFIWSGKMWWEGLKASGMLFGITFSRRQLVRKCFCSLGSLRR